MAVPLCLLAAVLDDHRVGSFVLTGLEALRQLAPGRTRVAAARRTAFAAAHRVIDRVHGDAAVVRAAALPARAPCLADVDAAVFDVADLADGGPAVEVDPAGLARRQPDLAPVAFLRHHLRAGPGRTAHLRAARDLELDVVNGRAQRDEAQRQVVARLDVRVARGQHLVADLQAVVAEDVALLAVGVVKQRDAGGPVRIVFHRRDRGRHAQLVAAEVNQAVTALVAAAPEPRGDAPEVVAPARLVHRVGERLLG